MNSLKFQDTKGNLKYLYQLSNTRCSVLENSALIANILPKVQVQEPQLKLHISYFLQKCKKGRPNESGFRYHILWTHL